MAHEDDVHGAVPIGGNEVTAKAPTDAPEPSAARSWIDRCWRGLAIGAIAATPIWAVIVDRVALGNRPDSSDWALAIAVTCVLLGGVGLVFLGRAVSRTGLMGTGDAGQHEAPLESPAMLREVLASRDLFCPGCGYNLRGLQSDRCPECSREISASVSLVERETISRGMLIGAVLGATMFEASLAWFALEVLGLRWWWQNPAWYDSHWLASVILLVLGAALAILGLLALLAWACSARYQRSAVSFVMFCAMSQSLVAVLFVIRMLR